MDQLLQYILDNKDKHIRKLITRFNDVNLLEEAHAVIVDRVFRNPRTVSNLENWTNLAILHEATNIRLNQHKYVLERSTSFDDEYNTNSFTDKNESVCDFNLIDFLIEEQTSNAQKVELNLLIETYLSKGQKKALKDFLQNENHIDDNHKVLFEQAKRKLIDVKNNPGTKSRILRENFTLRKTKMPTINKKRNGRYPPVPEEIREAIIKDLVLGNKGYNTKEVAKKYNVSNAFVRKELVRRNLNYTSLKV